MDLGDGNGNSLRHAVGKGVGRVLFKLFHWGNSLPSPALPGQVQRSRTAIVRSQPVPGHPCGRDQLSTISARKDSSDAQIMDVKKQRSRRWEVVSLSLAAGKQAAVGRSGRNFWGNEKRDNLQSDCLSYFEPPAGIDPATSFLPRTRSTTELRGQQVNTLHRFLRFAKSAENLLLTSQHHYSGCVWCIDTRV